MKRNATGGNEGAKKPDQQRPTGEEETEPTAANSGPPPTKKRKKERGQNKHRPRATRVNHSDQLCPSLYQGDQSNRSCQFGDKCRYCHDCTEFLVKKSPDISDTCYLFTTRGKCPYGLACRYGNSHMTTDHQNMTDDDLFDPNRMETTINVISRTLQEKLRKKKVELPKSENFLRDKEGKKGGRQSGQRKKSELGEEEETGGNVGGEREKEEVGGREEEEERMGEGENLSNGATDTEKAATDSEAQPKEETSEVCEPGKTAAALLSPTTGAVTDEDIVRLRPEEKKKVNSTRIFSCPLKI